MQLLSTTNHAAEFPTFGEIARMQHLECNGWALPWENHLRDHVISPLGKYMIHNF